MRYEFLREVNYINWRKEAEHILLTQEEFANVCKDIKARGGALISGKGTKCKRELYNPGDYRIEKTGDLKSLFYYKNPGEYIIYSTNTFDNEKNNVTTRMIGPKSISLFVKKFKELNKLGAKGFYNAFGNTDAHFKNCVPKQLYYKNPNLSDVVFTGGSVDACSHYPSNMMGRLPNANTMIKCAGCVPPNEEYPFAFYPESGHSAEYGVYNTRDWINSFYFCYLFKNPREALKKDSYTILMKSSEYTLDSCWEFFYNNRHEKEEYKMVMNATIGMMHKKQYNSYKYAHLAAVALCRANDKHLKFIEKIGRLNIAHVCVDGIIYRGTNIFAGKEKGLGLYVQEYDNCQIKISNANCYIVKKNDKVIKVKHGAYNYTVGLNPIDIKKVKDFDEQYTWIKLIPEEVKNEESI